MYFDEEIVLDARLNYLNPHVDYFIIIESCFTHRGDRRELNFDINKYKKFKDKIIYKVYDQIPYKIDKVFENDDETTKSIKYIMNALYRENGQRNYISEGIKPKKIKKTSRIGISKATDKEWNFSINPKDYF